jgi:hypothetical protein
MEAELFGRFLAKNLFLFAEGVKNISVGCKFHLSFIVNHLQFIIKKWAVPLVERSLQEARRAL